MPLPEQFTRPNPRLVDNALEVLAEELPIWHDHNFPDWREKPYHKLLGMIEEFGELVEARGSDELRDAIGDTLVYMCGYLQSLHINPVEVWGMFGRSVSALHYEELTGAVAKVCHHQLKMEQGIRGTREEHLSAIAGNCARVTSLLRSIAYSHDTNLNDCVERAWGEVRMRDWRSNIEDGKTDA